MGLAQRSFVPALGPCTMLICACAWALYNARFGKGGPLPCRRWLQGSCSYGDCCRLLMTEVLLSQHAVGGPADDGCMATAAMVTTAGLRIAEGRQSPENGFAMLRNMYCPHEKKSVFLRCRCMHVIRDALAFILLLTRNNKFPPGLSDPPGVIAPGA